MDEIGLTNREVLEGFIIVLPLLISLFIIKTRLKNRPWICFPMVLFCCSLTLFFLPYAFTDYW